MPINPSRDAACYSGDADGVDCRIPQQIYPNAAYFTQSPAVATTVAYQLPAGPAVAPAAAGPYSPRAVATSPAAAASPFFDLAVQGYPAAAAAGLTTIPAAASMGGYDAAAAAYAAGTFGAAIPAGPTATAGGYLIAAGGPHDGLTGAQFATAAAPPSAMTQYALHYQ